MSISPDFTQFIDLTLFDKDPTDIYEAALEVLQSRIPDWTPTATNIEVMLLEALAIEIGETVFNINRLPVNMLRTLLALYGVTQAPGSPPSVDIQFNSFDEDGYVIPAGTEVAITTSTGDAISFFTDTEANILQDTDNVVVSATADVNTNIANGIAIGTNVEIIEDILGVETAETASIVAGGTLPESLEEWTTRGTQRLRRLVDTLVVPIHFTQAALEQTNVFRANTVDNYDPTASPPGDPGDHPGNVTVVVYGDGGPLTTGEKEDLDTFLSDRANANLIIHVIDPTIVDVDVTVDIAIKPGFDAVEVENAVLARLDNYLNPTTWAWSGVVRRNELISVIDQVDGVDYVDDLALPATDIDIGADLALANAGTFIVTVI
jgi:uncharacterized phage protein gp47/JayE